MIKKLILCFAIFLSLSVFAQEADVQGALSRMGGAIDTAQNEFTMQDSYFLGRTVAAHILNRYSLYTARAQLVNYLNLICMTIVINSPAPNWYNGYQVMVLDDLSPNAFSTPGGHIFISRGLLNLVTSEDMLASVIAHEIAHIQLRHGISEIEQSRVVRQLETEGQRLSRELDNATQRQIFNESVNQYVQSLLGRGYSQLQEFEADSMSLMLLALAGYNPESLIDLIRILGQLPGTQSASLNTSHPAPARRLENLQRQIGRFSSLPNTSGARRNRFNQIMERSE